MYQHQANHFAKLLLILPAEGLVDWYDFFIPPVCNVVPNSHQPMKLAMKLTAWRFSFLLCMAASTIKTLQCAPTCLRALPSLLVCLSSFSKVYSSKCLRSPKSWYLRGIRSICMQFVPSYLCLMNLFYRVKLYVEVIKFNEHIALRTIHTLRFTD